MKTILTFLLAILPFIASAASHVFVKLNILDCIACTSALDRVYENVPGITVVLQREYMEDSTAIFERFNLSRFGPNIIWSDSLYKNLESEMFSEVVIMDNGAIKWHSNLKNLEMRSFQQNLDTDCEYKLPTRFSMTSIIGGIMMNDYVTHKRYILASDKRTELTIPDSLAKYVYLNVLKDTINYQGYSSVIKTDTKLKPSITTIIPIDASTQKVIYTIFRLDEVDGQDSIYDKVLACVTIKDSKVAGVRVIDQSTIPKELGYNEYTLFAHNEELYFSPLMKLTGAKSDLSSRKTLAKLKPKGDWYVFDTVYNFFLPDYLITSKIGYNFSVFRYSAGFLISSLSDYVIDLNTLQKFKLPLEDSILHKNANAMSDFKLKYNLEDFKYNKALNTFTILFRTDDITYCGQFTPGSNKLTKRAKIFTASELSDIRSYCLSNDGKNIIYSLKNKSCLLEKQLP